MRKEKLYFRGLDGLIFRHLEPDVGHSIFVGTTPGKYASSKSYRCPLGVLKPSHLLDGQDIRQTSALFYVLSPSGRSIVPARQ